MEALPDHCCSRVGDWTFFCDDAAAAVSGLHLGFFCDSLAGKCALRDVGGMGFQSSNQYSAGIDAGTSGWLFAPDLLAIHAILSRCFRQVPLYRSRLQCGKFRAGNAGQRRIDGFACLSSCAPCFLVGSSSSACQEGGSIAHCEKKRLSVISIVMRGQIHGVP